MPDQKVQVQVPTTRRRPQALLLQEALLCNSFGFKGFGFLGVLSLGFRAWGSTFREYTSKETLVHNLKKEGHIM